MADDPIKLLGDADGVVGIFSNYFQFLGIPGISQIISGALQKNDTTAEQLRVLQSLSAGIDDLINLAGATEAEVKMASLLSFSTPVTADEEIVLTEGSAGPHVDKAVFFKEALTFVDACENDFYWYRPLVLQRVFSPADMGGLIGYAWFGTYSSPDPPYRIIPPEDTTHIEGFRTVFDPQLALVSFAVAIKSFLVIAHELDPAGFRALLDPTAPHNYNARLRDVADSLQSFFDGTPNQRTDTLVTGFIGSDIPNPREVRDWVAAVGGGHIGFEWNGIYGAIDLYGIYPAPITAPSSAPSHRIDIFPTDGIVDVISKVLDDDTFFNDFIYPWIQDRLTIGIAARKKAIYISRGYDKAWSILQHLRVLTGQQLSEKPDRNRDWSVRDLFATFPSLPPASTASNGLPLSFLIERLRQVAGDGHTWDSTPQQPTPGRLDYTENGRPWGYEHRPIGLLQVIKAAAAL